MAEIKTHDVRNPHAVALGKLGGLAGKGVTSPAKARAARRNGKLGGRPKVLPVRKPDAQRYMSADDTMLELMRLLPDGTQLEQMLLDDENVRK